MTQEIFNYWYEEHFKPSVQMYKTESGMLGKVILLVDNCASHKKIRPQVDEHFEIIYLPPNTTALIQPMDQGVIAKFKISYRHKMLRRVLQYGQGMQEFYHKFNIKECINLVAESWTDITSANLQASWNKILCRESREIDVCDTSMHSEMTDIINALTVENNDSEELNTVLTHLDEQETINYEDDSTAMEIERGGNEEEEKEEEHDATEEIQTTEADRLEKKRGI
uniref:tigger transposable element-derived protein 1-like n=1 Tax=Osmia lignaria TaxID=473952 RepID=UPI001479702A|nr:tigger transposable element-derived protein 1-like [Osmia lignaria]